MGRLLEESRERLPKSGDIVLGTVIEKQPRRLFLDLGTLGTGIISGTEYIESRDIIKNLRLGEEVAAKIVALDNGDGYIEVSLREAGKEKAWQEIERLKEERSIITTKVLDANRGGLILEVAGIAGFLPVSQLAVEHYPRVEGGDKAKILEQLKKLVGRELNVRIIDFDPKEEKLIFSEREAKEDAVSQALKQYQVGDVIEGEVTATAAFGAFVRFGEPPLEGLIHISELDYKLISDPKSVVNVGDKIKAKIIGITDGRISLSLKALKEDPWEKAGERYLRGNVYIGTVKKINNFGAIIELDPEICGLCHISQFGNLKTLEEKLKTGLSYSFAVVDIQPKGRRLSLKFVDQNPPAAAEA